MTTTEPTPEAVEALRSITSQHRYVDVRGDYESGDRRRYFGCSCGWTQDIGGMSGYWSWIEAHEAHAARAVLAAGYVSPEQYERTVKMAREANAEAIKHWNRADKAEAKVARQRRILSAAEKAATTPGATAYDVKAAMADEWANIHGSPAQESGS